MKESEIGFKLRLNQSSMNLPTQHLVCKVEEVVRSIIRLKSPSSFRSYLLWEQGEDPVEIVFCELGLIRHQPSPKCRIHLTCFQFLNLLFIREIMRCKIVFAKDLVLSIELPPNKLLGDVNSFLVVNSFILA